MKAIQFEQYGEPAKVLAVKERTLPEPGKGECAFACWPVPSTHRTCCLCEDTMPVFNPIFHQR